MIFMTAAHIGSNQLLKVLFLDYVLNYELSDSGLYDMPIVYNLFNKLIINIHSII